MRKITLLGVLVLVALASAGCHHGHSSFNYGYSEGGYCEPNYGGGHVEYHRSYGHRSHGGHGYRDRHCD